MKQGKKPKTDILLLIKVPPPITGATLMNRQVLCSENLNKKFNIRSIKISYNKSIKDLGKRKLGKLFGFVKIFIRLVFEFLFHRPRFVYFQISNLGMAFYRDLIFVLLTKLFNIRLVYHLHGKGIKQAVQKKTAKFFYTIAFHNSVVICLSDLLVYDIEDVHKGKVYIVNNGIPDIINDDFNRKSQTKSQEKTKIVFLSNLIQSKGILDFIEALKILDLMNIDFSANIIGAEGDINEDFLSGLIIRNKLSDKVFYLGPLYNSDKELVLSMSDILVFPTKNDAWGNVILEAMKFGIPVIATKEGAIPEIIEDGITGYLIEKDSPIEIAEKLKFVIQNPELRVSMGVAGRERYKVKYTLNIFEKNLESVFNRVLSVTN